MRTLVIGDLHGCRQALEKLLEGVRYRPGEDRLIFLGDYIDRGRQVKETVARVIELRRRPHVICLKGNHEDMLLDWADEPSFTTRQQYLMNGGDATTLSYGGGPDEMPPEHMNFFRGLHLHYEDEEYIYVHAGVRPDIPMERQSARDLIWIRGEFLGRAHNLGKIVVFGHTPTHYVDPKLFGKPIFNTEFNYIGIDTGCVYGGKLTCLELPGRRVYQTDGPSGLFRES